jgi:hypothetical protein
VTRASQLRKLNRGKMSERHARPPPVTRPSELRASAKRALRGPVRRAIVDRRELRGLRLLVVGSRGWKKPKVAAGRRRLRG